MILFTNINSILAQIYLLYRLCSHWHNRERIWSKEQLEVFPSKISFYQRFRCREQTQSFCITQCSVTVSIIEVHELRPSHFENYQRHVWLSDTLLLHHNMFVERLTVNIFNVVNYLLKSVSVAPGFNSNHIHSVVRDDFVTPTTKSFESGISFSYSDSIKWNCDISWN